MVRIAPYLAGGLAAIVAMDYVPAATRHLSLSPAAAELSLSHASASGKTDRLAAPRPARTSLAISTVEVVGLQDDTAIVYRDRDGRVLFRTDPVNNVTVVTKGLSLPEVTVRQQANNRVKPMPVREVDETRDRPSDRTRPAAPGKPGKMPVGCESSFSPVASPAMAHHMGRCMAGIESGTQLAQVAG